MCFQWRMDRRAHTLSRAIRPPALILWIVSLSSSLLLGQDEATLAKHFEGRVVELKIDMPATKDGVNIHPERTRPLNYERYSKRLSREGVAIYAGERSRITKLKVKKKHIEFQLDGGGYGTFGDDQGHVSVPVVAKSNREKRLEKEIKEETDPRRKEELEDELEDLRQERHERRELLQRQAEILEAQLEPIIRERALRAGSRFNIRYDRPLSPDLLTPEAIEQALAEYIDFSP